MVDSWKSIPTVNGTPLCYYVYSGLGLAGYQQLVFWLLPVYAYQESKEDHYTVFIVFMLIILLVSLIVISLQIYVYYLIMGMDTTHFVSNLFEVEFPQTIKYYSVCALMASAFFFYSIWRQAVDREQQLREENLKYKYRTLKTQVNPHFLFNSLNTLSEIIYVDTKKADNYIQQLAGIYRYILDHEETDLISLKDELKFVSRYFDLQKERDGDKIQLEMNIRDAEKYSIVPISLQILVENALKHNSISEENPLKIVIHNEEDSLSSLPITYKKGIR